MSTRAGVAAGCAVVLPNSEGEAPNKEGAAALALGMVEDCMNANRDGDGEATNAACEAGIPKEGVAPNGEGVEEPPPKRPLLPNVDKPKPLPEEAAPVAIEVEAIEAAIEVEAIEAAIEVEAIEAAIEAAPIAIEAAIEVEAPIEVEPDEGTYVSILNACGSEGALEWMKEGAAGTAHSEEAPAEAEAALTVDKKKLPTLGAVKSGKRLLKFGTGILKLNLW